MPYCLVLTSRGAGLEEITAVPEGWVIDSYLYWPRSSAKQLRADEHSKPEVRWKKIKCRVKHHNIKNIGEALKLEEQYANFDNTEDEQEYFKQLYRQNEHSKTPNAIFDVNHEFNAINTDKPSKDTVLEVTYEIDDNILTNTVNPSSNTLLDLNSKFDDIITANTEKPSLYTALDINSKLDNGITVNTDNSSGDTILDVNSKFDVSTTNTDKLCDNYNLIFKLNF